MPKFEVEFREWRSKTLEFEADDDANALWFANQAYDNGKVRFKGKGKVSGVTLNGMRQENAELRERIKELEDAS